MVDGIDETLSYLTKKSKVLSSTISDLEWYLFGSFVVRPYEANDIDVLVVYNESSEPKIVRDAFHDFPLRLPLHLTFLLKQEVIELNFIAKQKTIIQVFPK